ncbi:hypothetical protein BGW36DRAFT_135219 [Talaromyces proteolyticus]|uniref:Uncharacterized protein n=1 Tax=Talaromyces proteolyticus TaxID=1131652 RepID=A0AAD4KTU1_9EURO|nr:uncharacterized protein BGW36DRAFT_135219 [Talaromyces proteolyticus]KAH8700752.1 hypothetical protein BGW36DRAFT_135219 [Talaromyces proteolyticus]
MGLIKTGLTIAGGYGLIKAASKAANSYEEKKQNRPIQPQYQPPPQQYQPGHDQQTGNMYTNPMNNSQPHPQWRSPYESQQNHGKQMNYTAPQSQSHGMKSLGGCPPPYDQGSMYEMPQDIKQGSA